MPNQISPEEPLQPIKTIIRAVVPRPVRNWLRSPAKSADWLWNCALFYLGARKIAPLSPGWDLRCHPHAYEMFRAYASDPDQKSEFENFIGYCSSAMFLFDIGAHFGSFSLAAAHFGGRAIAIDPSPTATRMTAIEAALNGLSDRIQIVHAAVSETSGTLALLNAGVFSDFHFQWARGRGPREMTEFAATTIDDLSTEFGPPSHIKIDVEGHEAAVIRGGRRTLREHSPILFVELHYQKIAEEGGNPGSPLDELDRLGYTIFSTKGKAINREEAMAKPVVRIMAKCLSAPDGA